VANLIHEKLIIAKLMIGKIMFKPTTTTIIMAKINMNEIIMA